MEVIIYEPRLVAIAFSFFYALVLSSSLISQANSNALKLRNATAIPLRSNLIKLPFFNIYKQTREYQENFLPIKNDTANYSAIIEENTKNQVASSRAEVEKAPRAYRY